MVQTAEERMALWPAELGDSGWRPPPRRSTTITPRAIGTAHGAPSAGDADACCAASRHGGRGR
eukprot:3929175-Lingulodinium_polyedra.AAC.1